MDLIPIIPDLPGNDKQVEKFQTAIGKLIRKHDHQIIEVRALFQESTARIELTIQCDKDLAEKITDILATQPVEETPLDKNLRAEYQQAADRFIDRLRNTQVRRDYLDE